MTTSVHDESLRLAESVLGQRQEFVELLTRVATYAAARDEVARTVKTLAGAPWELERHRPDRVGTLGVFLPSNNILYSLTLFGLIPSFYCDRVLIRSSARVKETAAAVYRMLADLTPESRSAGPGIRGDVELVTLSQRRFVAALADADVVAFTGQYENGLDIMSRLSPSTLYLTFGSGPNPLVIGPDCAVEDAVRAALASRLYNSGQDCLCADLIIVHESVLDPFLRELDARVGDIEVRLRKDPEAQVAPLVYRDAVVEARRYLAENEARIRVGGRVDLHELRVEPTVVLHDAIEGVHPPEFFSPVFCVAPYRDVEQLRRWAHTTEEWQRGMYMSVHGEPALRTPTVGSATVLTEKVTFDHEDGNEAFGGYGTAAGATRDRAGELHGHPLLLSAEIASWQRG